MERDSSAGRVLVISLVQPPACCGADQSLKHVLVGRMCPTGFVCSVLGCGDMKELRYGGRLFKWTHAVSFTLPFVTGFICLFVCEALQLYGRGDYLIIGINRPLFVIYLRLILD